MKEINTTHIWKAVNSHLYEHFFLIQVPVPAGSDNCIGYIVSFSVYTTDPNPWMTATQLHDAIDQIYNHLPDNYCGMASGGIKFSSRECPVSYIWKKTSNQTLSVRYIYTSNPYWAATHDLKNCTNGINDPNSDRYWEEHINKIF